MGDGEKGGKKAGRGVEGKGGRGLDGRGGK